MTTFALSAAVRMALTGTMAMTGSVSYGTTPAPAPPAISGGGGTASFSLSSTTGATLAPFTVGMALKEGQFPAGITVSGVTGGQASIRNVWPDGSAKFAIVSGRATVSAGSSITASLMRGTPSGTALTEADLTATGVTATLQFGGGLTMSLASLIGVAAAGQAAGAITAGRVRTLVSGPSMSSWLYCAPLSAGNVHIIGWMEVRLYVGGHVHVLPWVENGWTRVSSCAGQAGTLTFTLGGTTRFNQANVHLAGHCRVVAQDVAGCGYWLGTAPDLYCAPDPLYMQATGLVPPYHMLDTSAATTRLNSLTQAYSPTTYGQLVTSPRSAGNGTDNGDFDTGMADAGYHAGIGPIPEWEAFYLTSKADQRAWKSVIANAMGYGRYGVHFRDESTLRPFNPADGVNKTLPQTNNMNIAGPGANQFGSAETLPDVTPYDPGTGAIKAEYWAATHHPSAGFTAYLLTGQEFFLELCQFNAGVCFLRQNNVHRNYGDGLQLTHQETTRGQAWGLRSIFQAATISVDGSAIQTGFVGIAQANIAYYLANYITSACGSFGAPRPYSNFQPSASPPRYTVNAWEIDFSICAWGYGLKMKPPVGATPLANMLTYFQWHAQFVVGRLGALGNANTYGFNAAGRQNSVAIANSSTDAPWIGNAGPWMADWGEAFSLTHNASNSTNTTNTIGAFDSNNGFFPDATSYWGNLQTALAYAVEHGVSGAWDGYLRMVGASNWSQFDTSAATQPVGALKSSLSPPSWRSGMSADTFNTLTGTNYLTAAATLIPTVTPFYRGTAPRDNVVDGYSDPAFDPVTGCFYLWGGGHGDGTYNGVIKFDPTTKVYSVVGQPTPPSVYLPDYAVQTTPIYYPSGVYFAGLVSSSPTESPRLPPAGRGGFFYTVAEGLNATTDAGYIAPALAKISAHAYAASVIRGRKIHYFCTPGYAEFDIDTGTWSGWDVDMGAQLKAINSAFTNYPFSQGNAAVYDEVTDRFIVLLQAGDYGMGARNGVFVFDPVTRLIESAPVVSSRLITPSSSMVKAGRKVYIFTKVGNYLAPQNMNQGVIYDIDAGTFAYFSVQSDPSGTIFSQTTLQETIPAWFDGTSIHRWNYEATNGGNVHTVNLTPVSGVGTLVSPYILAQSSRAVTSPPSGVQYRYRGNYWPAARAMVILPRSNQDWRVLPLS